MTDEVLDKVGMIAAAKALATQYVAVDGISGDVKARFLTEADAKFASQLGAVEIVDIWDEAAGLDPLTKLPRR